MKKLAILAALATVTSAAHGWTTSPIDVNFVNAQGIKITGKLFKPAGTNFSPRPAVVMLHGCSGAYSYSDPAKGVATLYREWGDRLVANGYVALLVDSFTPRNADQNQCGNGSGGTSEVNDRPYDAYAAHDFLAALGYVQQGRIGLLGWSHGGSSTLAAMEHTLPPAGGAPFRAAVAFYPGCGLWGAFGGSNSTYLPNGPLKILHGSADDLYQSGDCQDRVADAAALGAGVATGNPMEMTVYSGAQHSFDQARSSEAKWTPADFDAKAQADTLTVNYLDGYLK